MRKYAQKTAILLFDWLLGNIVLQCSKLQPIRPQISPSLSGTLIVKQCKGNRFSTLGGC